MSKTPALLQQFRARSRAPGWFTGGSFIAERERRARGASGSLWPPIVAASGIALGRVASSRGKLAGRAPLVRRQRLAASRQAARRRRSRSSAA